MSMANMCLLAKTQTAIGNAAVPTPGDDAMLVSNITLSIIKGKSVERNLIQGARGNYGSLFVGAYRSIEFEVEAANSGTPGVAPKAGRLLMGCDMQETVTAGVSVEYMPTQGATLPLTLYGYLDGTLFKMTDAKGTWSYSGDAETIPKFKFQFIGRYHKLEAANFPAGLDFSDFIDPLTVGFDNTPVFNVHGTPGVMQQFSLDMAYDLVWRDMVNFQGVRQPDRKPKATVVMELDGPNVKDWGEAVRTSEEGAITLTHGIHAGNILTFSLPRTVPVGEPTLSEQDKVAMLNATFDVKPVNGNDEVVLTFT
jgi:hypothetical protein